MRPLPVFYAMVNSLSCAIGVGRYADRQGAFYAGVATFFLLMFVMCAVWWCRS